MELAQFWFVALSWWLVSEHGPGAVAVVLVAGAVPLAVFMLVGGAKSDRVDPALIMRVTAVARLVILALTTVLAYRTNAIGPIVILSAAFGVVDGYNYPAVISLLPKLAGGDISLIAPLQALVQICDQIAQIIGPVMASAVLTRCGVPSTMLSGIALAVVSVVMFGLIRYPYRRPRPETTVATGISGDVIAGVRYVWSRPELRSFMIVVAGLGLATVGPMTIGSTLLARDRFGGASSLGWLLGAFGVGALIGALIAGRRKVITSPTRLVAGLCIAITAGMSGLAFSPSLPIAIPIAVLTSMSWGYEGVITAAWIQSTTEEQFRGRVASLLGFAFLALDPVSQGISGALTGGGAVTVFLAGAGVVAVVGISAIAAQRRT